MYSFAIMMCEIVMTYMLYLPGKRGDCARDNDHSCLLADVGERLGVMCTSLGVVLAACGDRDPSRRMTAQSALSILKDAAVALTPPPIVPVDAVREMGACICGCVCLVALCSAHMRFPWRE
jgi:hypothetical protein